MAKKKDFFEEKLKQFWQKGFKEQEKAEFEQFLAENPFEQEAFEGLQHLDKQTFENDIAELTQKLPKQKPKPMLSFQVVAASVLILVGIVGIIWWLAQSTSLENPIALQKNEPTTSKTESFTHSPETARSEEKTQYFSPKTETESYQTQKATEKYQTQSRSSYVQGAEAQPLPDAKEFSAQTETAKTDEKKLEENLQIQEAEKIPAPKQEQTAEKFEKNTEELQEAYSPKDDREVQREGNEKKQALRTHKLKADRESRAFNTDQATQSQSTTTAIFQGKVLEANTQKPLQEVVIFWEKSPTLRTTTNAEGSFSIQVSLNEKNILHLQKKGYKSQQVEIQDFQTKTFYLQPEK